MIRSKKDPSKEVALCFTYGKPLGSADTATNNIPRASLAFNVLGSGDDACANKKAHYAKTVEGVAGTEKWAPITNEADA